MAAPSLFVLRPLVIAGADSVASLIRAAFAALPVAPDPPMSALRVSATDVVAHLRVGGGAMAEADGETVGCALWRPQDSGLYLSRIAVAPPWRGRGIARALIAEAEATARGMRLPRLHLSTRLVLTGNRRLFAACGFVEAGMHAHPGYTAPTFVDMEKRLADAAAVPSPLG